MRVTFACFLFHQHTLYSWNLKSTCLIYISCSYEINTHSSINCWRVQYHCSFWVRKPIGFLQNDDDRLLTDRNQDVHHGMHSVGSHEIPATFHICRNTIEGRVSTCNNMSGSTSQDLIIIITQLPNCLSLQYHMPYCHEKLHQRCTNPKHAVCARLAYMHVLSPSSNQHTLTLEILWVCGLVRDACYGLMLLPCSISKTHYGDRAFLDIPHVAHFCPILVRGELLKVLLPMLSMFSTNV